MSSIIRLTRLRDATLLPDIERSAGEVFRYEPDLMFVVDGDVMSAEAHHAYIEAGSSWVAERETGELAGFLAAERFDDQLHIWELAVRREYQRQGLGRRLLDAAYTHARAIGLEALTLTTFRDVAWNEPLYRRLGFETLAGHNIGPRLKTTLAYEITLGLPGDRRCAMRRKVITRPGSN